MNFAAVLSAISAEAERSSLRYAVIGGVALAALGMPRTTLDVDIVADTAAQPRLVAFLESLGFATLHRSHGYSNHLHRDPTLGRVDIVYVEVDTADQVFAAAQRLPGPGGIEIPVAAAEHLVAMKVLAMKNDPARALQELADIRFLLSRPDVDRGRVRRYFEQHGMLERFEDVAKTL